MESFFAFFFLETMVGKKQSIFFSARRSKKKHKSLGLNGGFSLREEPIALSLEMPRADLYRDLDRGVEAAPCVPVVVG